MGLGVNGNAKGNSRTPLVLALCSFFGFDLLLSPKKGAQQPMSIVAKRSPISATAELLLDKTNEANITRRCADIQHILKKVTLEI